MVGDKGVSFENVYTTCCKFEITTKRNIIPDIFKWQLSFSMTSYRHFNEKILSNAFYYSCTLFVEYKDLVVLMLTIFYHVNQLI